MSQKDDVLDSRIVSNNQIVYSYTAYMQCIYIYNYYIYILYILYILLCCEITRFNYPFEGLPRFAKIKRTYDIRGSVCVWGATKTGVVHFCKYQANINPLNVAIQVSSLKVHSLFTPKMAMLTGKIIMI